MTAPAATRPLYCTKCGRVAIKYADTLDPAYPLVSCSRRGDDGEEKGCGVQPGSRDTELVEGIVAERRRKRATANHHWHERNGKPNPWCDRCRADPPALPTAPHPYEEFRTKYRTAGHLELVHHDRAMIPRLPVRPASEVTAHHRRLHG